MRTAELTGEFQDGIQPVFTRCRNCGCMRMTDEYFFEWLRVFGCLKCRHDDFEILTKDEFEKERRKNDSKTEQKDHGLSADTGALCLLRGPSVF